MSHHPESHGHWDVEQIDALLRERDALREQLRAALELIGLARDAHWEGPGLDQEPFMDGEWCARADAALAARAKEPTT